MKKYQLVIHLKGSKIISFNEIKIPFFQDSSVKTSAQYAATEKKKKKRLKKNLTRHCKHVEQHKE